MGGFSPAPPHIRLKMASEPQSATPQTIPEVLASVEARQFWERVYIACVTNGWTGDYGKESADAALTQWRERFGKAGE